MYLLFISVKKCCDTGLAAQISVSGKESDEFLIVQFNAATGIDIEESLIDLLLVDALEVEAYHHVLFLNLAEVERQFTAIFLVSHLPKFCDLSP